MSHIVTGMAPAARAQVRAQVQAAAAAEVRDPTHVLTSLSLKDIEGLLTLGANPHPSALAPSPPPPHVAPTAKAQARSQAQPHSQSPWQRVLAVWEATAALYVALVLEPERRRRAQDA